MHASVTPSCPRQLPLYIRSADSLGLTVQSTTLSFDADRKEQNGRAGALLRTQTLTHMDSSRLDSGIQ
eukprot:502075-Pleurochrysis_carterae.AAC.2